MRKNNQKSTDPSNIAPPTNSLWFVGLRPQPCEKKAWNIDNEAQTSITNDDQPATAVRFLQSRAGANTTRNNVVMYGLAAFACATLPFAKKSSVYSVRLAAGSFFLGNIPPNASNHARYRSIEKRTDQYLSNHCDPSTYAAITNTRFQKYDLMLLAEQFRRQGHDPRKLTNKANSFKQNNSPVI